MTVLEGVAKTCFVALLLLLLGGCDRSGVRERHRPAESVAQVQSLDIYVENDRLHLLTGEYDPRGKSRTLWYRQSADGGSTWSKAARVDAGSSPVHEFGRGHDAQIAASRDSTMAVWTSAGTGWGNSGPLAVAVSDKGKPWRRHSNPADDDSTEGHSFVDLRADEDGAFHIVWLDGRVGGGVQGLRYSRTADAGASGWRANGTLDAKTCECCWNTLLNHGKDIYALYRGLNPRDMCLVSSSDGGNTWRQTGRVGAFDWNIDACPHTGGALAITSQGGELHALVWTGRDDAPGVYHLASADAGETWTRPNRLGGETAKHADLTADENGNLAAVWDERDEHVSAIFGSLSNDDGLSWSAPRRLSDGVANASHPRVAATRWGFRVFWTEASRGGSQIWKTAAF